MNEFRNNYGEWALVTGATSGIGKALAFQLAAKGMNLILVARRQNELDAICSEIQKQHEVSTKPIQADLAENEGIKQVIEGSKTLKVGFLVLSAGIENNGLFTKNSLDSELQLIQLNVVSTLKITHHFAQQMVKRNKGGILLISSLTAHMPSPYFSNYAASKSYVLNFGKSLYGELAPKGVHVSVLSPGVTDTSMAKNTGINWSKTRIKIMQPEEVAAETLKQFGKKLTIIPGKSNRIVAFLTRHIIPDEKFSVSNQKMLQKVLSPSKI